jgi:hypothetical protein
MKTRLSSSITFFWKYIFSTLWLGGFGLGTFIIVDIHGIGEESQPFLIGLVIGLVFIYYGLLRAKAVYIDENYLYVSNFIKEVNIPLESIKEVSEYATSSPRLIFIKFKNETEFGKKIMFIGRSHSFLFFSTHPSVKEIRKRINNT